MQAPNEIPFSSVEFGTRGRSEYARLTELAQSIEDNGLIQPIVLVPLGERDLEAGGYAVNKNNVIMVFGLDAGGRRYRALQILLESERWDGILHHATTSEPGRPGYILKGEKFATPLQRAMTEIAENLDREDVDWRDHTKMIVRAYKLSLNEAHANGENILMRDFGAMIGVEYMKLRAAVTIHDDLIVNPDRYKDVTSIRGALAKLLKVNEIEINKLAAIRSMEEQPKIVMANTAVSVQSEPQPESADEPSVTIPLSKSFANGDSLAFMEGLSGPTFDHIITDPDYGVSIERLEAGATDAGSGVAQETIADSIATAYRFIELSAKTIKDQGFLIFWYDLDHHEKLQAAAITFGFRVQRWPLIWVKTDYRSNAGPAFNFTKNIEYAMVCRKPNAVLAQAQNSSVFNCSSGTTTRDFGHPFAKPLDVWRWIYTAVTIKGQSVYDPFLGSGSSAVAAAQYGLKPMGHESDTGHYSNAIMNLQRCYKKLVGGNVSFT